MSDAVERSSIPVKETAGELMETTAARFGKKKSPVVPKLPLSRLLALPGASLLNKGPSDIPASVEERQFIVPKCMENKIPGECVNVAFLYIQRKDYYDLEKDEKDNVDKARGIRAYIGDIPELKEVRRSPPNDNIEVKLRYCQGTAIDGYSPALEMNEVSSCKEERICIDRNKFRQQMTKCLSAMRVPEEAHPSAIEKLLREAHPSPFVKLLREAHPSAIEKLLGVLDEADLFNGMAYLDIYDLTLLEPGDDDMRMTPPSSPRTAAKIRSEFIFLFN